MAASGTFGPGVSGRTRRLRRDNGGEEAGLYEQSRLVLFFFMLINIAVYLTDYLTHIDGI